MTLFVGRTEQLAGLRALMRKKTASLVTCRGRRRIGKSRLIHEFGKEAGRFVVIEGLSPRQGASNADQLRTFAHQLAEQSDLPELPLASWPQALQLLASVIRDEWTVILLDEISWLGGYDPDFAGHLKVAWDNSFKKHSKLILVLCGSVSSWIEANILHGTGFVGRDSWDIFLEELPLPDCHRFWGTSGKKISAKEKLDILSVTGGVPRYLEEVDTGLSAEENIRRLCFHREGILFREFEQIFSDVFGKRAGLHKRILEALAGGSRTVSEISQAQGKERSGHMTEHLQELVLGGFVARDTTFDPKTGDARRLERYRLRDNYSRFYLRYVAPRKDGIEKGLMTQVALDHLPGWDAIRGLQFENLVLNNVRGLFRLMAMRGTSLMAASPYLQRATKRRKGCQIDLLMRTKHSLYIVEIKHRKIITSEVIDEVREKVDRLPGPKGISVRTALVYCGELHPKVELADYFDHVIPFEQLLKGP